MTEFGVLLIGLMIGFLAGWLIRGFIALKDILVLQEGIRRSHEESLQTRTLLHPRTKETP
jgi:hypothetical protein